MMKPRQRRETNLVKAENTKLIHTSKKIFFDIIGYKANPALYHKNTRLRHYFIQDPKAPQATVL